MRIWHQSFTVLEDLPAYRDAMAAHIKKVVRPDTQVEMHGQLPGTYPSNYPGTDLGFVALTSLHSLQWVARAIEAERSGFDAYAMATIPNPLIREIRTIVDIPVVGYGEASYHIASMLGRRFGLLIFIDRMAPLLEDHIAAHGLSTRCVGVRPSGVTFQLVLAGYSTPGPVIELFQESARELIRAGADVIIPGEMPLNVILAINGVTNVDGVPILDGLAVTMKLAEAFADLHKAVGFGQTRRGFYGERPAGERLDQVLSFYGLDRLLGQ
jgi:Asp/Glu/hydantoin racemase